MGKTPEQRPDSGQPASERRPTAGEPSPEQRPTTGEPSPQQRPPNGEPSPQQRPTAGEPFPEERTEQGLPAVLGTPRDIAHIRIASYILFICIGLGLLAFIGGATVLGVALAVVGVLAIIDIFLAVRRQRHLGGGPNSLS